jgi:hypothetical protein
MYWTLVRSLAASNSLWELHYLYTREHPTFRLMVFLEPRLLPEGFPRGRRRLPLSHCQTYRNQTFPSHLSLLVALVKASASISRGSCWHRCGLTMSRLSDCLISSHTCTN